MQCALSGDFESASRLRQKAYTQDPPGSIGIDWNNWNQIWELDSRYIHFLIQEPFLDMDNTTERVFSLKSGMFIDYLWGFRDSWGVKRQSELSSEPFLSHELEAFLESKNWLFECENRELIYAKTKSHNINAKIYLDSIKQNGMRDLVHTHIFLIGEYDLGFSPEAPQRIIDGRRKWLETYDQFEKLKKTGIDKFPKTFQTFEKHKRANDEKYQNWISQYKSMKNRP